ncbi:hypothetical protein Sm713_42010 [Streptomyces sp. TS71-3]|nr:hypothetical protein Sm713_42010 [Streptomyces sp. TS71-3]
MLGRGPGAAPVPRAPAHAPDGHELDNHEPDGPDEPQEPVGAPEGEQEPDAPEQEPVAAPGPGFGPEPGAGPQPDSGDGPLRSIEDGPPGYAGDSPLRDSGEGSLREPGDSLPSVPEQPGPDTAPVPEPDAVQGPPAAPEPAATAVPVPGESPQEAADDGVFKVRLVNFEGPFDLLLQLISKHKMDVTEVALSKVTDEFMAHIRAMGPDWNLDETTEFLVVAATLLDLKAARLLPAAEVEDEADLALLEARDLLFARLLQYRAYKQIADIFTGRMDAEASRHPRTVGLEPHHAELLPDVVISIGPEGFAKLAVKAMQPKPVPQVYVDHIHAPLVSVVEQAEVVVARLRKEGEASFRDLVADAPDTLTVVARFLALLELYREKAVGLDQDEALGELIVRWTGGEGDVRPQVTDEFDRAPDLPEDKAGGKGGGKGGTAGNGDDANDGGGDDGNADENGEDTA